MGRNKGISLIVLVITIIVMIILAGTIILTLNNNGIIDRANEAVKEYNLDEVEQVASLAWAEAYLDGARTQQELETAVQATLAANKITEADYEGHTLKVTENGVALEKIIAPGLYQTGSNYTVLLKNWDTLVSEGIIDFDYDSYDGGLYATQNITGDLVVPATPHMRPAAFDGCDLTNIVLSDGQAAIYHSAFQYCTNLKSVKLPVTLNYIDMDIFYDCPNFTDIYYDGSMSQWNSISFNDDWNSTCGEITVHCSDGTIVVPA